MWTARAFKKKRPNSSKLSFSWGSLGTRVTGPDRVTPYLHILVHHASKKHQDFMCLGWFSSEGVEKKNDILKNLHHAKSNKWNAAAEALKLAKRLEVAGHVRTSRPYRKHDRMYWDAGLIQESRAIRARSAPGNEREDTPVTSVEEMDAAELRTELKAIGISTAVKAVGKLREILRREREKRLN
ncbi:hypothetical protein HPB48_014739 [Haemaphysalis longicornis]|uniref:LEM domain-containing protein n=1 Tax=Haemaphysalis longicornis TaxID=44386 RepID=A0A9J6G828_HAELO|nr:hypothetical protein HPB48_014739 [Haemaphysalis longicornis]